MDERLPRNKLPLSQLTKTTRDQSRHRPIPAWKVFCRSLRPLRVIAEKQPRHPLTHEAFLNAAAAILAQAAAGQRLGDKSLGLWRLEKLSFAYCRHGRGNLNTGDVPLEILPIAHVGLGIASTESAGFSPAGISREIESHAHVGYQEFSFESAGCIWAVCASPVYRLLFRIVSRARLKEARTPPWHRFVGDFPAGCERLLSHGYGRTLYFKHCNVLRAIREAERVDSLDVPAAARGIAFACAMLNHADLPRVLETELPGLSPQVSEGLMQGLSYALAFWDWPFPGTLDSFSPESDRQERILFEARHLIGVCRTARRLTAFDSPREDGLTGKSRPS